MCSHPHTLPHSPCTRFPTANNLAADSFPLTAPAVLHAIRERSLNKTFYVRLFGACASFRCFLATTDASWWLQLGRSSPLRRLPTLRRRARLLPCCGLALHLGRLRTCSPLPSLRCCKRSAVRAHKPFCALAKLAAARLSTLASRCGTWRSAPEASAILHACSSAHNRVVLNPGATVGEAKAGANPWPNAISSGVAQSSPAWSALFACAELLDSFGHAKTAHNASSSRFGLAVHLAFEAPSADRSAALVRGRLDAHLLETSRLTNLVSARARAYAPTERAGC